MQVMLGMVLEALVIGAIFGFILIKVLNSASKEKSLLVAEITTLCKFIRASEDPTLDAIVTSPKPEPNPEELEKQKLYTKLMRSGKGTSQEFQKLGYEDGLK